MEQTQETSTEVSIIEKLNANNLPELIGWKEKQETLVKENPFVEITDTKTYESACKARTNLLKGRTELEKQDKAIASKVAQFRKEVGGKTAELIEITLTAEQTQQTEVKRWEGIKEAEKAEKERLENERIEGIKNKANELESSALEVIQKMTYTGIVADSAKVSEIMQTEFDFEEYEILYTGAFSRVQNALEEKVKDLTERENQRIAKEKAEAEAAAEKAKNDLQAKRLNEILPYLSFGAPIDATKLNELSEEEFQGNLSSKKGLYNAKLKADQEAEAKRKAQEEAEKEKAKKEKDAIFEIRKNRLLEIGFIFNDKFYYDDKNITIALLSANIYAYDTIDFENKLNEVKKDILEAKQKAEEIAAQKEADEKASKADAAKLKKENAERFKRLSSDKNWLNGELEKYFSLAPLEYLSENQEIKDFIKSASERIDSLKCELLNELENL